MFSNTGYEALYKYLGLMFHSASIEIITSEPFFKGLVLILFGGLFLLTAWKFTARHMMGNLVRRHNVPLSQFVKITLCLILGISILRVGSEAQIKSYSGFTWNENQYVKERLKDVTRDYEVSLIFDILSRTAEELGRYTSYVGEFVFGTKEDSYLKGPHGYAKAIILAGSDSIDDPDTQNLIESYTRNCVMKILPKVSQANGKNHNLSSMYRADIWVDSLLEKINLKTGGDTYTCRDLKDDVKMGLRTYTEKKVYYPKELKMDPKTRILMTNVTMSSMLNSYYKKQHESMWGIYIGSQVPGLVGTLFQYLNRLFGWDATLSIFGQSHLHGASEAAKRAQKFSELLARAPHIKGIIQMILIGIFPWLIFFIVIGKWKVLIFWFWCYLSVCMWTPIWTIMYYVMHHLTQTSRLLTLYGELSDGISLYAANMVMERIYYSYSVFTLAQTIVPIVTTGMVLYFLKPALSDSSQETSPEFIEGAKTTASTVAGVATGLPTKGI